MKKIDFYKHIEGMFKDEIEKGFNNSYCCDEFIESLYELQNNPDFEENYQNGDFDYIFHKPYSYSIDSVEYIMDCFKEKMIISIDYDDWYSIKYFMNDIEDCNNYCMVDESEARIVKWEDSYAIWLDEVLEDTQYSIKENSNEKEM